MYVILDDDDIDELFDDDNDYDDNDDYEDAYNTGVCIGTAIAGAIIAIDSIFDD